MEINNDDQLILAKRNLDELEFTLSELKLRGNGQTTKLMIKSTILQIENLKKEIEIYEESYR